MKHLSIVLILFFFFSISSVGQHITRSGSIAIKHATVKVSSLKQVQDTSKKLKDPNRKWQPPNWTYDKENVIYRQAASTFESPGLKPNQVSPTPDTTFAGLQDNGVSIPPDVNGAAGPDHLMQTLNTEVRISDKEGNELFTTTLNAFWVPLPGSSSTFDPKIVYDPYNDRWIMITPSSSSIPTNRMYVGVSLTSDPLGEWHMFYFDPDTTNQTWFDYPNLGFNKNWISIGGILRDNNFDAVNYVVYSLDKMAIYNGDSEVIVNHFLTTLGSAIVPSFTYDKDQEEMYLISTGPGNENGNGYVNLFKLSGEVNDPDFELLGSVGVPEPWENWSYEYHPDFLPQMGSDEKLNSVDARMHTMINRNNKLWAVHHIYLPADDPERCAIQWWSFDTTGAILERGRIDEPAEGLSFAYPSIAVNAHEDVFIGHGVFSETKYAGAAYSFKAYFDDPSSMRTFYEYKAGLAPYYKTFGGDRNRWGDYSAVFVDPDYDTDFWAMHEYAEESESQDQWGTWWAFYKPSYPPIADFTSDEILIPVGETVNFTDLSLGVPTGWIWEFEGGTPINSTKENPADILFSEEGAFDVLLISSNELGADTILKEKYIVANYTILPEVTFYADNYIPCAIDTVSFYDMSNYSPIAWEWQFEPNDVTFVNGTDNTSQNPQVIFNTSGEINVRLTVWNLNGSSDSLEPNMIAAGGYQPWYKETFEPETFKLEDWTIQNPDAQETWEYFEVGGNNPGNMAAGIDFSQYFAFAQRDRLISPPLNLENLSTASLSFEHAYAARYPGVSDSLILLISSDCGDNWTKIFSGGEDGFGNFATHQATDGNFWAEVNEDWCMAGWGASCLQFDLSAWAGMSNVKIAFESYSSYGNPLFVDNIVISQAVDVKEPSAANNINVYPVPAKDAITIEYSGSKPLMEIRLINQLGKIVYREIPGSNSSKVEIKRQANWTDGVYFIQLINEKESIVKEIIFN